MGLLNIFKKKSVPEVLPDLASDEIEKNSNITEIVVKPVVIESPSPQVSSIPSDQKVLASENNIISIINVPGKKQTTEIPVVQDIPSNNEKTNDLPKIEKKVQIVSSEKSFFSELEKDLEHEIGDLNNLEDWYNNKFMSRDMVSEMRRHWEKKKDSAVINALGRDFQGKIIEDTESLQILEKEWQEIYFDLIEKEEEIKEKEKELKKVLSEFVELCKKKKSENH